MSNNSLWPQMRPHPIQKQIWESPARFVYLAAGRQSGKSELAFRRLIAYLPIKRDWPTRYFYAAPTLKQARRVAWDRLLGLIPDNWIADVSLSDLRIKTIFGSELFLDGLDSPQRIEGQILDGGIIDEAADVKLETFARSILGTLVTHHGWCWQIGVCKRHGIGASEFRDNFFKAQSGEMPNAAAFTWPSSGVVTEEELEIARAAMDVRTFQEQFEATWIDASGGIFYDFSRKFNVRPCLYDPSLPLIVASDFNVDPMAWIIAQDRAGVTNVIDELWIRNTNTPAALIELLHRYGDHKAGFQMYGDASGKNRHTSAAMSDYVHIAGDAHLTTLGRTMHYTTSNPPVADRFASCNARICNGVGTRQLFVDPSCTHLILDLETRSYKPGTRETDDTGDQGHMTDALGYYLHQKFPLQLVIHNSNTIIIHKRKS